MLVEKKKFIPKDLTNNFKFVAEIKTPKFNFVTMRPKAICIQFLSHLTKEGNS